MIEEVDSIEYLWKIVDEDNKQDRKTDLIIGRSQEKETVLVTMFKIEFRVTYEVKCLDLPLNLVGQGDEIIKLWLIEKGVLDSNTESEKYAVQA